MSEERRVRTAKGFDITRPKVLPKVGEEIGQVKVADVITRTPFHIAPTKATVHSYAASRRRVVRNQPDNLEHAQARKTKLNAVSRPEHVAKFRLVVDRIALSIMRPSKGIGHSPVCVVKHCCVHKPACARSKAGEQPENLFPPHAKLSTRMCGGRAILILGSTAIEDAGDEIKR